MFGGHFRERTKIQQKRPKFAGPIYFHTEVYLEVILESVRKIHKKRPKFAGPIYFHTEVYLEVSLESVRKSNKKGPNLPAQFISTRMYIQEVILGSASLFLNITDLTPCLIPNQKTR